jgi:hypothetical protein
MRAAHLILLAVGFAAMLTVGVLNSLHVVEVGGPNETHLYGLLGLLPVVWCLFGFLVPRRPSRLLTVMQFILVLPVTISAALIGYVVAAVRITHLHNPSPAALGMTFIAGAVCWLFVMVPFGGWSFALSLMAWWNERMIRSDRD